MQIDPPPIPRFQPLRRISYAARILREMQGIHERSCNICGFHGKFSAAGRPPRYDAKCPRCQSVERHRLVALAHDHHDLPRAKRTLHFAPEPALSAWLRATSDTYQSADIVEGRADLTIDIEQMDFSADPFDRIVASHVLEHVDDTRALRNLYRSVVPGGHVLILTPIVESWPTTYENPDVEGTHERLVHFGQEDHVRYYGGDLRERITAAGFALLEYTASPEIAIEHGLSRGETLFIARRPTTEDA